MKTAVALAAALAASVLAADESGIVTEKVTASDNATIVDGIAAKVNGDAITIGEVLLEVRRDPVMHLPGAGVSDFRRMYRQTLENMIDRKLILRDADQQKLQMQDWVVDNRIREIVKDNFNGDFSALRAAIDNANILYDNWKRTIRDDLVVQAMQYQMVARNVTVSPSAMRAEYAVNADLYAVSNSLDVSVILLGATDDKSASDRAAEAVKRLDGGEDFAAVAKAMSSDPHASDGGVWKNVQPEETFKPAIVEALNALGVGQRSNPIELQGWVTIIRKDAEHPGIKRSFAEAYDDIHNTVRSREARRLHKEWIKRLRDKSFIVIYEMPGMGGEVQSLKFKV